MPDNRRHLGAFGEQVAREYLEKCEYQILQQNYRCSVGEIDIVARDGDSLAFVEVRTRSSRQFGTPEESITRAKQAKLIELAESYLQEHQISNETWRIDVVAVEVDRNNKVSRIELIENAVG
jgi:putative endonuclease